MYPQPYAVSPPAAPRSSAEFRRRALYRGGNVDRIPFISRMKEAATCGVAMLVPLYAMKSGFPPSQNAYVEVIPTPGATMSGFNRPSPVGPRLLKPALLSSGRGIAFPSSIAPPERV